MAALSDGARTGCVEIRGITRGVRGGPAARVVAIANPVGVGAPPPGAQVADPRQAPPGPRVA